MVARKLKHEILMFISGCCEEQEPCTVILEEEERTEKPSFMNYQIPDFYRYYLVYSMKLIQLIPGINITRTVQFIRVQ